MMFKRIPIKIERRKGTNAKMNYEDFIDYLLVEGEARIKINNCRYCILNQDSFHNKWPIEFLIIQEDKNYNELNSYYINKKDIEKFYIHEGKTLKELFRNKQIKIIELF